MTELQPYRTALPVEEQAIRGRRSAVEAELQRIERAGRLVSRDSMVDQGRGIVTVRIHRQLDPERPSTRQGRHPAWYVAIMLSAAVLVLSIAWAVAIIATAVAAIATLILGLLVVVGAVLVVPRILGGDSYTQIMNIRR